MGFRHGAALAVLLGAPIVAVSAVGTAAADLPFLPYVLFEALTRVLPGRLVTMGIEAMVVVLMRLGLSVRTASKPAEQTLAVMLCLASIVVVGFLWATLMRAVVISRRTLAAGIVLGLILGLPLAAFAASAAGARSGLSPLLGGLWVALLVVAWGAALGFASRRPELRRHVIEISETTPDRRGFLVRLGLVSASVTVVGAAVATVLSRRARAARASELARGQEPFRPPSRPGAVAPAPGTRPEYTPVADHYRIDISLSPPSLDARSWRLEVKGLVDHPVELSLQDFERERWGPPLQQIITLACISNPIAGDLIGTTRWTGVSLGSFLADLGVKPEARFLNVTSADGFHESVSLDLARGDERIMLAYAWDGAPLPREHGFPLRLYIPDRYGMKQPKWITGLELTADERPGYWVQRSWDKTARMRATSVIDTVAVESRYQSQGRTLVPIGGIAHAGARGISRVEVQVDGGLWTEAGLRTPLSPLTWVLWRYDWPFTPGHHTFAVRCYDGSGQAQIAEERPPHPSGATGIHSVSRNIPRA